VETDGDVHHYRMCKYGIPLTNARTTRLLTMESLSAPTHPMTDYSKHSLQSPQTRQLVQNATQPLPFSQSYIPNHAYAHEASVSRT
jgi:hypothetical protein